MDDQITKLYVAYFHRDQVELTRELVGNNVEIIVLDELETMVAMNHIETIRFRRDPFMLEPEPCQAEFYVDYDEPKPKPMKTKLLIKQPRMQPFRQRMRSVNRNR